MPIRDMLRNVISRSDGLYPLTTTNTRALPEDYRGPVITSDIDRTYLESSIHSLRGLVRTALESAEEKRAFAGMIPLYHALRHGPGETPRQTPLYFVSASPPQMEEVLREKMALDGIRSSWSSRAAGASCASTSSTSSRRCCSTAVPAPRAPPSKRS